jgi:general secretion pathway protein A
MYKEYFGLEDMPFSIAPDPRYLYMSEQHREALAHLLYGVKSDGGFVLLTGEVGTGKTTVCRCLLEQMPGNSEIAFIINPKLTVEELLATICEEFGIKYPAGNTSIKVFVDLVNAFLLGAHAKGLKTILIIDEAQNLKSDVLEQLRLLTNLETNQHKLLQIILIGQPELRDLLSQPGLRQLSQRIIARYHLGPLSRKDVSAYVSHRLEVAGLRNKLFPLPTIDKLCSLSNGVPRLINVLCDRAMLGAFVQGQGWVSKRTLVKAAREVFGETNRQEQSRHTSKLLAAILAIAVFGILLMPVFRSNNNADNKESHPAGANVAVPNKSGPKPIAVDLPEFNTLQWPDSQPFSNSQEMAYQALFKLWGITSKPHKYITACQQAEVQGLSCFNSRGSLDSLRQLNMPVILKLIDDRGQEYYAALTTLEGQTAAFIIGTETIKVSVKDIASQWTGDYTLLWQIPKDYQKEIRPGYKGHEVQWLDEQLARVQGRPVQPRSNMVFDEELVRQVKEFQLSYGLVPDGIVGTQTLMQLSAITDANTPKLMRTN